MNQKIIQKILDSHREVSLYSFLADPVLFKQVVKELSKPFRNKKITKVLGIESRGLILGSAVAYELGVGFIPVRKPSALQPFDVPAKPAVLSTYFSDYSKATKGLALEDHQKLINKNDRILVVDDWFATGNHARAVIDLLQQLKRGTLIGFTYLFDSLSPDFYKEFGTNFILKGLIKYPTTPKVPLSLKTRVVQKLSRLKNRNQKAGNQLFPVIDLLYEASTLRNIHRSHLKLQTESIAEHTYEVAFIGYVLAELSKINPAEVVLMCLVHDLGEARVGDANLIQKVYSKISEDKAIADLCKDLPSAFKSIETNWQNFHSGQGLAAQLARDADILAEMVYERTQLDSGIPEAKVWLQFTHQRLKTPIAQELAQILFERDSFRWWYKLVEDNFRI